MFPHDFPIGPGRDGSCSDTLAEVSTLLLEALFFVWKHNFGVAVMRRFIEIYG